MKQEAARTRPGNNGKTLGRNGYRYRQQFGIVVVCKDERDQAKQYARLKRAGYQKLRVVTV